MESNPVAGLLGLLMILQLIVVLAVLLGGLYALYCFSRAAAGLDRLASAVETWVTQNAQLQAQQNAQNRPLPGQNAVVSPATNVSATESSGKNPDWIKPIELPNMPTPSNAAVNQSPRSEPEVVQLRPPHIPSVSPPFGHENGPMQSSESGLEGEAKRD